MDVDERIADLETELSSKVSASDLTIRDLRGELAAARARNDNFRSLVSEMLIAWQKYTEDQYAAVTSTASIEFGNSVFAAILAERLQCMLDVRLAIEHPETIVWPDGHPRKTEK